MDGNLVRRDDKYLFPGLECYSFKGQPTIVLSLVTDPVSLQAAWEERFPHLASWLDGGEPYIIDHDCIFIRAYPR